MDTETVYIRNVPETAKNRFKAFCGQGGFSMTSIMIEIMRHPEKAVTDEMIASAKKRDEEERSR